MTKVPRTMLDQSDSGSRDGIALVIVLGFLALLTLLAISFTVQMRTERMTSQVYMDSVQSRHFLDVALARAMADLDQNIRGSNNTGVAPDWEVFASSGTGPSVNLWGGEAMRFLPRVHSDGVNLQSRYVNIPNPLGGGDPIGRYAYLAVNMTGLLDVNEVGRPGVDRERGLSPAEIQITAELNPEISGSWPTFSQELIDKWRRMETLHEFSEITGANLTNNPVTVGLFARSRVERDPNGDFKLALSDANQLTANEGEVKGRLLDCEIPAPMIDDVFNNLIDFLDEDRIPQDVDGYGSEPGPMINEVIVSNQMRKTLSADLVVTTYIHQVYVVFEVWNPFPEDYTFKFDYNPNNISFPLAQPSDLDPSGAAPSRSPGEGTSISIGPEAFRLITYTYEVSADNIILPGPGGNIGLRVNLGGDAQILLEQENDASVDRVDFGSLNPPPTAFQTAIRNIASAPFDAPYSSPQSVSGINVDDPRMNHVTPYTASANDPGWTQSGASVSPDAINPRAFANADRSGEGNSTTIPAMYVRNRPFAADAPGEIAELGYVGLPESYRTIALYNHPDDNFEMNPVLDYFTVVPSDTTRRGMVSLNSVNIKSLASVFVDTPLERFPGGPSVGTLTEIRAEEIAQAVFDELGIVTNLSEFGTIDAVLDQRPPGQRTDDIHETIIRNSIGLLTTRQNLFGIILDAQSLGEAPPDGSPQPVTGSSRAVAFVWRDPTLTDPTGVRLMVVRQWIGLQND